jgi:hypothetical protein
MAQPNCTQEPWVSQPSQRSLILRCPMPS